MLGFSYRNFLLAIGLLFGLLYLDVHQASAQIEAYADDSATHAKGLLIVRNVVIKGNGITKPYIIERELSLKPGSSLACRDTLSQFNKERNRIFNTRLFVVIYLTTTARQQINDSTIEADLLVTLKERWYTFPYPVLELADRNFAEWWYNRNRDITRLNYGVRLTRFNLTGRADPFRLSFQQGFTRRYGFAYSLPYLGKSRDYAIEVAGAFSQNNIVNIRTDNNRQTFLVDRLSDGRSRTELGIGLSKRVGYYQQAGVDLNYFQGNISDSLLRFNPNFFGNGSGYGRYTSIGVNYVFDYRNFRYYPTKGWVLGGSANYYGLAPWDNMRALWVNVSAAKFFTLPAGFYYAANLDINAMWPNSPTYALTPKFGVGQNFVRGYDRYVVEAPYLALTRHTLRKHIWGKVFEFPTFSWGAFNTLPIDIYLKAYADFGYSYAPDALASRTSANPLVNQLLSGFGLGVDIVTFYDQVIRLEYSFTRTFESNFFPYLATDI